MNNNQVLSEAQVQVLHESICSACVDELLTNPRMMQAAVGENLVVYRVRPGLGVIALHVLDSAGMQVNEFIPAVLEFLRSEAKVWNAAVYGYEDRSTE